MSRLSLLLSLLLAWPAAAANVLFVAVGDPGNPPDSGNGGDVSYLYAIALYETTNEQYADFLNAVAVPDTNGLYDPNMDISPPEGLVGYLATPGLEKRPVGWVSFWSAVRYANWTHNGRPVGAQDPATTEDGAYTLTPTGVDNNTVTRNANAHFAIPTASEWYKAAFYDPALQGYHDYPAGSDELIVCAAPSATSNTANCGGAVGSTTDAGAYSESASPYGTFDQGGNIGEWLEASDSLSRLARSATWSDSADLLSNQSGVDPYDPSTGLGDLGFRVVALVPEPSADGLAITSALALVGLRRRRQARAFR